MAPLSNFLFATGLGLAMATPALEKRGCASIAPASTPEMAPGYTASVVTNSVKSPRQMVFDSSGKLLVLQENLGVQLIKLYDNGGTDICVASSNLLIHDETLNHGLELSADGSTIFVSSISEVYAYPYYSSLERVGQKTTVITGLNITGSWHKTRTLRIPSTTPDLLLVQRGSDGNIDAGAATQDIGRSMTKIFDIASIMSNPVDYATNGVILSWGQRNSVGWGINPVTGGVWSVENSADNIEEGGVDIHMNNPAEELNYHGAINDTFSPQRGGNYGYPSCFSVWDPSGFPGKKLQVGEQTSIDGSIGDPTQADCLSRQSAKIVFPAHTAPVDIKFKDDGSTAYIAFHGSWDRNPPDGFRVSKVDFTDGMPTEPSTSTNATSHIMKNANTDACPDACFRPTGLTWDGLGRLWVSSDSTNEIFVVSGA